MFYKFQRNMNCLRLFRSVQQKTAFNTSLAKYVTQHPLRFIEAQDGWREKDGVSKRYKLIYKAPMDKILNYATAYLTLSTTTIACSGIYYGAFVFDVADINTPVVLGGDVVIANSGFECLVYLGAFVIFHIAVKVLLDKYVLRLYKDGDNYLAIFRGHFFNTIKKHEFRLEDFKKLNPTLVVSWGDARYGLGNKHAIILENYFKTPEYFNYLLMKRKAQESTEE